MPPSASVGSTWTITSAPPSARSTTSSMLSATVCACPPPCRAARPPRGRRSGGRPPGGRARGGPRPPLRLGECGPDALVGVRDGAIHQDVDRALGEPDRRDHHQRRHEEGGRRVGRWCPARTSSSPPAPRTSPRDPRRSAARSPPGRRTRAARHAEADHRARGVHHDDDDEHRERPPRHIHVVASSPPASRRIDSYPMNSDTSIRNALSPSAARCSALPCP